METPKCECKFEYLIFNKLTKKIYAFDTGEAVFYADREEAEHDLNENEEILEVKLKII